MNQEYFDKVTELEKMNQGLVSVAPHLGEF